MNKIIADSIALYGVSNRVVPCPKTVFDIAATERFRDHCGIGFTHASAGAPRRIPVRSATPTRLHFDIDVAILWSQAAFPASFNEPQPSSP
jgi:hypothetical protein